MGLEQKDNKSGFQYRYPALCRVQGNTAIVCQGRIIQNLPCPAGRHGEEAFKTLKVADVYQ
jgi:hypothetical protein